MFISILFSSVSTQNILLFQEDDGVYSSLLKAHYFCFSLSSNTQTYTVPLSFDRQSL